MRSLETWYWRGSTTEIIRESASCLLPLKILFSYWEDHEVGWLTKKCICTRVFLCDSWKWAYPRARYQLRRVYKASHWSNPHPSAWDQQLKWDWRPGVHISSFQQRGDQGSRASSWTDWMYRLFIWGIRIVCMHIFPFNIPSTWSARKRNWIRLMMMSMPARVLHVSACAGLCSQLCLHVCSSVLGIHAEAHLWFSLGTGRRGSIASVTLPDLATLVILFCGSSQTLFERQI